MLKKGVIVLKTNIVLFFKKIFGCNVKHPIQIMMDNGVTLKTRGKKAKITFEEKCYICKNTELATNNGILSFDEKCFVNRNCVIVAQENIKIGAGTTIGPGTYIYDHDHDGKGGYITKPITIGKNVWIGAGCIILKGVCIEDNSVVGAGTLVTFDCQRNSVVYQKRNTIIKNREF